MVEEFFSSEKTQRQFCKERNLQISVFQYWFRKYKQESAQDPGGFIPVQVKPNSFVGAGTEIVYVDGTRLVVSSGTAVEFVRQLLPAFVRG